MKTINVYQKGDKVMVKGVIAEVTIDDNGTHKYRLKDGKSGLTFGTWYTGDEVVAEKEEGEQDD